MSDTESEVYEPFIWKGTHLDTIGNLLDAAVALESPEESQEFMTAYRAVNQHADQNIGYIAGYCGQETMQRILDWTGTGFGRSMALRTFTKAIDEAKGEEARP